MVDDDDDMMMMTMMLVTMMLVTIMLVTMMLVRMMMIFKENDIADLLCRGLQILSQDEQTMFKQGHLGTGNVESLHWKVHRQNLAQSI